MLNTFVENLFEAFKIKKDKRLSNDEELDNADKFKQFFGDNKFRIKLLNKEYVFNFTVHAMSRYIERDGPLDKKYINELLTKVAKSVYFKEKDQLFLVFSRSLQRALVVVKKADDLFHVVTTYPQGASQQSTGTKKIIAENHLDFIIDEYIEID